LAYHVEESSRATAFGFHRAMDNTGALLGPLLAMLVLYVWPGKLRYVFAWSLVPGLLAVITVWLGVKDVPTVPQKTATTEQPDQPPPAASLAPKILLSNRFRYYLFVSGIFALANASDFFLMVKAKETGIDLRNLPLVWATLSLLRALAAWIGGWCSDHVGRRVSLFVAWLFYGVAYAGFAMVTTPLGLLLMVLVYSCFYGLSEGAEKAIVSQLVDRSVWGKAFGFFALVKGMGGLVASVMFGVLYRNSHGKLAFLVSASIALGAALLLVPLGFRTPIRNEIKELERSFTTKRANQVAEQLPANAHLQVLF
jgi:MFS family permease